MISCFKSFYVVYVLQVRGGRIKKGGNVHGRGEREVDLHGVRLIAWEDVNIIFR